MSLYIGLMSGTSLDGVDGVLAELDGDASSQTAIRVLAHHQAAFPDDIARAAAAPEQPRRR